ncbi:hypothetical protein RclHR1_35350001, partial [Rhizophagus clarus]
RKFLPEKWLTLNVSTFKKFVIQVQKSIGITVGVEDIDQSEYTLFFKSDKSNGGGLELSDSKDFEKFQNEYEKLFKSQKEIVVVTQMKHNVHKKKRKYEKFLHLTNLQTKLMVIQKKKKVNSIPKVTGLTPQQKAIEQFLADLDREYGANTFTKYLDVFKGQEVDILDIINFKDSDWIILGIEKVGPKTMSGVTSSQANNKAK